MTTRKSRPAAAHHIPTANNTDLPFQPTLPPPDLSEEPDAPAAHAKKPTMADVDSLYAAPPKPSAANAVADPAANLQTFTLGDLAQFTKEKVYSTDASKDVHLFFVGRDDVHDILKYILSRVSISLYLNMFGFDDDELNNIIMQQALDPTITMLITLDQSQAGGVHEKALIAADQKYNLAAYNTHFVIGQSATHQISHTKGFVADGKVACEGSTNWSSSGEGTFVVTGAPGGAGYKAQNNTQSVITDRDTIIRFQTELITEHMTAESAAKGKISSPSAPAQNIPVTEAPGNVKHKKAATHKA
jgi:hypothetical protein